MPCVSLFITKCFQAVQNKNNFRQDKDVSSILYFIPFNLKIRLLSPELFSSVLGKGLYDGLLTKRFTTRNFTCQRECRFLSIFTSTPVIQCLSHSAVQLLLMIFISYKNHGSQEKSCDEDNESKLICDNDQMHMLKTQESVEDEDYDEKEQRSPLR
jgi:hypothetical protein